MCSRKGFVSFTLKVSRWEERSGSEVANSRA